MSKPGSTFVDTLFQQNPEAFCENLMKFQRKQCEDQYKNENMTEDEKRENFLKNLSKLGKSRSSVELFNIHVRFFELARDQCTGCHGKRGKKVRMKTHVEFQDSEMGRKMLNVFSLKDDPGLFCRCVKIMTRHSEFFARFCMYSFVIKSFSSMTNSFEVSVPLEVSEVLLKYGLFHQLFPILKNPPSPKILSDTLCSITGNKNYMPPNNCSIENVYKFFVNILCACVNEKTIFESLWKDREFQEVFQVICERVMGERKDLGCGRPRCPKSFARVSVKLILSIIITHEKELERPFVLSEKPICVRFVQWLNWMFSSRIFKKSNRDSILFVSGCITFLMHFWDEKKLNHQQRKKCADIFRGMSLMAFKLLWNSKKHEAKASDIISILGVFVNCTYCIPGEMGHFLSDLNQNHLFMFVTLLFSESRVIFNDAMRVINNFLISMGRRSIFFEMFKISKEIPPGLRNSYENARSDRWVLDCLGHVEGVWLPKPVQYPCGLLYWELKDEYSKKAKEFAKLRNVKISNNDTTVALTGNEYMKKVLENEYFSRISIFLEPDDDDKSKKEKNEESKPKNNRGKDSEKKSSVSSMKKELEKSTIFLDMSLINWKKANQWVCYECNKESEQLQVCSRCNQAVYCCSEHQKKGWEKRHCWTCFDFRKVPFPANYNTEKD